MEDYVVRGEYDATIHRLEDEDKRENERLKILENDVKGIGALTSSVDKLATNMELMLKEQEKQGKRLEVLEGRDGEKWRTVVSTIATAAVGILVGFIFASIGIA